MQNSSEEIAKTPKKTRSPWDKEGAFKFLHRKLDKITEEVHEGFKLQDAKFRVLFNTLSPLLSDIPKDFLISLACQDEADESLLHYLFTKGDMGITPTEACTSLELKQFHFKPFHITRRIQRMNKRLKTELDKSVAESRGRRWVMTSYAQKAWGSTKEELEKS